MRENTKREFLKTSVATAGVVRRTGEESPSRHGFHGNCNAETYFLIGDAMGRAMLELMKE